MPVANRSARLLPNATAASALLGESPAMRAVLGWVAAVCHTETPVLITGESGTGKELVARALHFDGPRRERPFVALNCAAFPDALVESELFGHCKGAFTGAVSRREGRFKMAHGGTLFLDEISELSASAQAKLLRVLQEGTIEPLGMDLTLEVDVRILSATHCDLKQLIADGKFREDLYYRLNVLGVELPPLRARAGDVRLLVDHLVRRFGGGPGMSPRALEALEAYPFPGNVRELENVLQHALVMANGRDIELAHLPGDVTRHHAAVARDVEAEPRQRPVADQSLAEARRVFERAYLIQVLGQHKGHRTDTARALKISRKGLWEKLRDHEIEPPEYGGTDDDRSAG